MKTTSLIKKLLLIGLIVIAAILFFFWWTVFKIDVTNIAKQEQYKDIVGKEVVAVHESFIALNYEHFVEENPYLLQLHDRFYEGSGQVYKLPIGTVFNITDAKSFYHKVSGTSNNYLLGSVEIKELGKLVEFEIPWGYDGTSSLNNKASFNLFELMPWQEEALPYKFYHDGRKEPHVWPPRIRNYVFNIVAHKFISRDTLQQHRNFENIYEKQEDWAYEKVYFGANNQLSNEQIDFLKLGEIYADYKTKPEKYAFHEDYKLEFSRNFITLIVTVFLGEHEMESQLITYDLDGNKIANLKISYDEIAEGMHKKESFLKGNILTINDMVSVDTATVTTTKYRLLDDGKIELVKE